MKRKPDKKPPTERERFEMFLGCTFPCLSETMVRKCWRELAAVPPDTRQILADALMGVAAWRLGLAKPNMSK